MSTTARSPRRTARDLQRLRAIHWGWWLTALFSVLAAFKEWPRLSTSIAILAVASIATYALRGHARRFLAARARGGARTALLIRPLRIPRQHAVHWPKDPYAFEQAVADLAYRDPQVRRATAQGGSNDRTLDVLVELHSGQRIHIQCKRYAATKPVDVNTVYAVNGTYRGNHCDQAVIITTSRFTDSAVAEAQRDGIRLINNQALTEWANGGTPPWN